MNDIITLEGAELTFEVTVANVVLGRPESRSGHPDNWTPAEGTDFEIESIIAIDADGNERESDLDEMIADMDEDEFTIDYLIAEIIEELAAEDYEYEACMYAGLY